MLTLPPSADNDLTGRQLAEVFAIASGELPPFLRSTPLVGRVAAAAVPGAGSPPAPGRLLCEVLRDRARAEVAGLVRTILDEFGDLARRNPQLSGLAERVPAEVFRELESLDPAYDGSQGCFFALVRGLTERAAVRLFAEGRGVLPRSGS